MSNDLLSRATEAMRATTLEDDARAASTRARVMASLHKGRVKKRTRIALVLPIAATFAAATALGASGGRLGRWVRIIEQTFVPAPSVPPASPTLHVQSAVNKRPPAAAPAHTDEIVVPVTPPVADLPPEQPAVATPKPVPRIRANAQSIAPAAAAEPVRAARTAASAPAASAPAAPKPEPAEAPWESGPGGALYLAAHRAHFVQHDPAAALRAWDAYLAAEPHGRFEPEARYNRALCLLRLGKTAEAREALTPFAEGRYGNYRQREAAALLGRE